MLTRRSELKRKWVVLLLSVGLYATANAQEPNVPFRLPYSGSVSELREPAFEITNKYQENVYPSGSPLKSPTATELEQASAVLGRYVFTGVRVIEFGSGKNMTIHYQNTGRVGGHKFAIEGICETDKGYGVCAINKTEGGTGLYARGGPQGLAAWFDGSILATKKISLCNAGPVTNLWADGLIIGDNKGGLFGVLGSQGSYRLGLTWNGYRRASSTPNEWEVIGVNGSGTTAQIMMGDDGISLCVEDGRVDGNQAPATRIKILPDGNVGIGISDPKAKLHAQVADDDGIGVKGVATHNDTKERVRNYGGYFETKGNEGCAVFGHATSTLLRPPGMIMKGTQRCLHDPFVNRGGYFIADAPSGQGICAQAPGANGEAIHAEANGQYGKGLYAEANGQHGEGLHAEATGKSGVGILAKGKLAAAKFRGNVQIQEYDSDTTIVELGKGLDFAEGFDVSDNMNVTPGTVLVIDADSPGRLKISNRSYDRKVAGIVTGAKGLGSGVRLGGEYFDRNVALAGRVYCNVDAMEVEVEPGDLLTTSATKGYAMKATDDGRGQGAILGKAMEKLEKGTKGQILVLVTLQ